MREEEEERKGWACAVARMKRRRWQRERGGGGYDMRLANTIAAVVRRSGVNETEGTEQEGALATDERRDDTVARLASSAGGRIRASPARATGTSYSRGIRVDG